jgi:hypothetical protein
MPVRRKATYLGFYLSTIDMLGIGDEIPSRLSILFYLARTPSHFFFFWVTQTRIGYYGVSPFPCQEPTIHTFTFPYPSFSMLISQHHAYTLLLSLKSQPIGRLEYGDGFLYEFEYITFSSFLRLFHNVREKGEESSVEYWAMGDGKWYEEWDGKLGNL